MPRASTICRAFAFAAISICAASVAFGESGSFLSFEPEVSLSSNPGYSTTYDGDALMGSSCEFAVSFDRVNAVNPYAGGRIAVHDYEGDEADFNEFSAVTGLRYGQYAISRLVRPHGIELSGLHPRTIQDFRTSFFLYDFTAVSTTFEEDSLSKYDSSDQLHLISYMTPISLDSDWLLLGAYDWALHESDGVAGYRSQGGELALLVPLDEGGAGGALQPCIQYVRSGMHLTNDSLLRSIIGTDVLMLMTGWQQLGEFDGPFAADGQTSVFLGEFALAKKWGRFAAGLEAGQRPAPSLVAAYQTERWFRAASAVAVAPYWRLGASIQQVTADRFGGEDVSLISVEANAQWEFADNWKAFLRLEWRTRDSQLPDDEYSVNSVSLSVRWNL